MGAVAGRRKRSSRQFLNATGALPLWICIVAAIAANCGSLEVIAMMALGAQYGMLACHFYWIGAIPALVVLAFWLLPSYTREGCPTVPEFVGRHYGTTTQLLVTTAMAAMMLLLAGVCLCAAAEVLTSFFGWKFYEGILLVAPVVLCYTLAGGLRATVYTQLLHFALVLAAVVPLAVVVTRSMGGLSAALAAIPAARMHAWQTLPWFGPGALMDRVGLIAGLGLVLSFGYWSTDFVLMQRALAVRRAQDVRYVPLALAGAKLIFPLLIVLPGLLAPVVLRGELGDDWNAALPLMMRHFFTPAWLLVGLTGLMASLVATFANNISGFTAAWMEGIYRPWMRGPATDAHYLRMSRVTTAAAVLASAGTAFIALDYRSLMEYMQMIFAVFNAPIFAVVALAAVAPHRAANGGSGGFILGLGCAAAHQMAVHAGLLHYGSRMSANFYAAIAAFVVALTCTLLFHRLRGGATMQDATATGVEQDAGMVSRRHIVLAGGALLLCCACNIYFW